MSSTRKAVEIALPLADVEGLAEGRPPGLLRRLPSSGVAMVGLLLVPSG